MVRLSSSCLAWTLIALVICCTGCASNRCSSRLGDDSLADAWRTISGKRFVDLTHTFSPTTPVYAGFGPAVFEPAADRATGEIYTIE